MKQKHLFFIISILLYILLFYKEGLGMNFGILSIFIIIMSYYIQIKKRLTKDYKLAVLGGILGSISFMYYRDFVSFLVIFFSLNWIAMLMYDPYQKLLKLFLLAPINYLMALPNAVDSKTQFNFIKINKVVKEAIAYVLIPLGITAVFLFIYMLSSDITSNFFKDLKFDFNIEFISLFWLTLTGAILMYLFWFFKLPKTWKIITERLDSNYTSTEFNESTSFDMVRKSAEITFILLNVTLLIFIGIYGVENISTIDDTGSISNSLHNRVYAVIASIVMAITLILYFFRGQFNFDKQNKNLKRLTYTWILLNSVLVLISFIKNVEYVYKLGLTEKRLGVFLFLILCLIGLYLTFQKINLVKTNWYLLNRMSIVTYFSFVIISFFNWGWIITKFNIETNINIDADISYYRYTLSGNEALLYQHFKSTKDFQRMQRLEDKYKNEFEFASLEDDLYSIYTEYLIQQLKQKNNKH